MKSFAQLKTMSKDEVREESRRIGKELTRKVITGVVVTIAVHFIASAVINKLDPAEEQESLEA